MNELILHVPFKCTYTLRHLFYKEEEFKNSKNEYMFEIFTSQFLMRSRELIDAMDRELGPVCPSDSACEKHQLLNYLKSFRSELFDDVLERGKYPTKLHFEKVDRSFGVWGWYPVRRVWVKDISHKSYSQRLAYCK